MKMTMHIDEATLAEVMKITGAPTKTAAVEMALNELARKSKLKTLLKRGLSLKGEELKDAFFPGYLESFSTAPAPLEAAVAEAPASYGKRRTRR